MSTKTLLQTMSRLLLLVLAGAMFSASLSAQDNSEIFILVHGSFQDSSSWDNITPLLEAQGHTVVAPNLLGHGTDTTDLGEINLQSYRDQIINIISEYDQPVILVGHSFGGIVISEVAEAQPDMVKQLIYVAGYIPRNGDSLASIAELDQNNGFSGENFLLAEDFTYAFVLEEDFLNIFCGDCDEAQADIVMASRQNEPLAPLNEPSTVTEENFGSVDKAYILTAEDNASSPQIQIFMLSHTPVRQVYALNTSHVPFVTMPEDLANLIMTIASQ